MLEKLKEKYKIEPNFNSTYQTLSTLALIITGINLKYSIEPLKLAELREDFPKSFVNFVNQNSISMKESLPEHPIENIQWLFEKLDAFNFDFSVNEMIELMIDIKDFRAKIYLFEKIDLAFKNNNNLDKLHYEKIMNNIFYNPNYQINLDLLFELPSFKEKMMYGDKEYNYENLFIKALISKYTYQDEWDKRLHHVKDLGITLENNKYINLEYKISQLIQHSFMNIHEQHCVNILFELKNTPYFAKNYETFKELISTYGPNTIDDENWNNNLIQLEQIYLNSTLNEKVLLHKKMKI